MSQGSVNASKSRSQQYASIPSHKDILVYITTEGVGSTHTSILQQEHGWATHYQVRVLYVLLLEFL